MSDRHFCVTAAEKRLQDGWTVVTTPAGLCAVPGALKASLEPLPAPVPGTLAGALERAGRFDRAAPTNLEHLDAWYRLVLDEAPGPAVLRFEGLATLAEVFLNGQKILDSESMFEAHDVPVVLTGRDELALCFRAIGPHLDKKGPRARWRPRMMRSQGLRLLRTTALGFMPGWCPDVVAVGPWRPVSLLRQDGPAVDDLHLRSDLDEAGTGHLALSFDAPDLAGEVVLHCAGRTAVATRDEEGRWRADLVLPAIDAWWPASHGTPVLHDVTLTIDGRPQPLGRTGFRRIAIDRGADGRDFALTVNGEPVFCRGAVWTSANIVDLPGSREAYAPFLKAAAEAGMNMIRIGGTMAYESADFFALCDELGLMVWQDLMLANFDYPANDESLMIHVKKELTQLLRRHSASPSLAILCGGSEMHQQGAMLGLPERIWKTALTTELLPALCAELAPRLPYVENSPCGGSQPFFVNEGVGHYYGVGAYLRPLEDARRANLRFAAESLAFANVPDAETLAAHLPVPAVHDPRWKARVPRDVGASWDFEDVRDHYAALLYGIDPARLRREDPDRYLAYARATTAEVMEASFAEWRRPGSTCHGALVWTLQDLLPGAGWGVIDATGRPKSVWYALKRAFRPLQVLLSDEGVNGLDVHVLNETAAPRDLVVELACLRDGEQPVVSGRRDLSLGARSTASLAATDLFGAFFDTTYAYRFGPPSHDVTVARLLDAATGERLADAFHFPLGRPTALHRAQIDITLNRLDESRWALDLSTNRFAQSLSIACDGWVSDDDGFHLAPGGARRVILRATSTAVGLPGGRLSGLDGHTSLNF
ncbi:glycoside hydrolase family 2 protein [Rhizobium sp. SL86]|uniref:glycoside hydrolase family 2 protein n=1 Tax=Rhizobium sp. SL86 TaxID=2995148 RepID=UPI002276FE89|nr:glycoside hydrolase family 2 protein [Rhizobium sp. SL86]MCY1665473.1 glycoside hydrolase family 2 protein [Rhizobium sp. SL86]